VSKIADSLAFFAMASFWALNYPLVKFVYDYQSPLSLLFFRILFATIFSFIFFWRGIKFPRDLKTNLSIMFFGFINIVFFMGFWFVGESTESSSLSSIIIYTYPVISIVLSAIFLKEKLTFLRALGTILGFAGMILIFIEQLYIKPGIGLFFLIAGATSWAIGTVYFKKYLLHVGNFTVNSLQFLYTLPFVFLFDLGTGAINFAAINLEFLAIVIYMGSLSTSVAYYIYLHLYSKYSVSSISSYFFAVPALSIVFGYFLIPSEVTTLFTYFGFGLISVGIYMSSRGYISAKPRAANQAVADTNK
jgi:drug/metabolite transporter (DMT)-like permease